MEAVGIAAARPVGQPACYRKQFTRNRQARKETRDTIRATLEVWYVFQAGFATKRCYSRAKWRPLHAAREPCTRAACQYKNASKRHQVNDRKNIPQASGRTAPWESQRPFGIRPNPGN